MRIFLWFYSLVRILRTNSFEYTGSAAYEPTINEVQVPVLNRELCNEWLVQLNVTEGMICAGYKEGGKDACQVSLSIFNLFPLLLAWRKDLKLWSYEFTLYKIK